MDQARTDNRTVDKTPTESRQAVTHQGVRYVLGFGLVGVVIAFAIAYFAYFAG